MDEAKRKAFLGRVSKALGRTDLPPAPQPYDLSKGPQQSLYQGVTQDELIAKFKLECDKVGTKYIETAEDKVGEALLQAIEEAGGGKVIYPDTAEIEEYRLEDTFGAVPAEKATFIKWDAALGRDANIENAQDAQAGITFPVMGIAETATILQPSGIESGRSIGLLPITHIAVLHKSNIVPRMTQSMAALSEAYQANPADFPSNLVHISGPSNTADIELVRVVGVHGPINVTYVLVG